MGALITAFASFACQRRRPDATSTALTLPALSARYTTLFTTTGLDEYVPLLANVQCGARSKPTTALSDGTSRIVVQASGIPGRGSATAGEATAALVKTNDSINLEKKRTRNLRTNSYRRRARPKRYATTVLPGT